MSMLQDPLLQERYLKHLDGTRRARWKEIDRCKSDAAAQGLAKMYHRSSPRLPAIFAEEYGLDLMRAFREFQDAGQDRHSRPAGRRTDTSR